jgi:arylsulfatase A-like enzyme/predicted Zn-dependent protease
MSVDDKREELRGFVAIIKKEILINMSREKDKKKLAIFTTTILTHVLILFFVSACYVYSSPGTDKGRLNVLLITIDTLRTDWLSCYGGKHLETPNIDSLSERGVLFSRAFANTSTTLPSHANILLGTTPPYHGVHDNINFVVREEFLTLAEYLKEHDYSTGAFIGAFPLHAKFGLNQGFDTYDDKMDRLPFQDFMSEERRGEVVIDRALSWLKKRNSPWFLWIHCWDPHDPYEPPEPFLTQYKVHPYTGEVAYVDFVLGRFFAYLEENNLFENTLVIFTGDHGESLGQHGEKTHGFLAYNTTIWIPLIIISPGLEKCQVEHYVSHIDIFPTVCDILNLEKPPFLQGISLVPALKGKKVPQRPIYFESLHPYYSKGWAPLRGFVSNNEKYTSSPIPEFYDLGADFDEKNNLAAKRKLDRYEKQLEKIMSDYTYPESQRAEERLDKESLEKLRSLGYISSSQDIRKDSFSRGDDVKVLLPYYNQAMEALEQYGEGNKKQGFETLKKIITERKDFAVAYINLADLYKREKRLRDAVEVLKIGHENVPSDYFVFFSLLNYLQEAGQYKNIIQAFHGKSYLQMKYDPAIWNLLGNAYYKTRNLEKAIDQYEMALSIDAESQLLFANLGEAQFSLAVKKKDKTMLQKALQSFQKAIELDPDYSLAYFGFGKACRLGGNFDAAITAFKRALEIEDKLDEALFILGLTYLEKGDKNKALSTFTLYKQKYYDSLPDDQKQKLDDLIRKSKQEMP